MSKTKLIKIFGEADQPTIDQANNCLVEADALLLMADNHKGYGMPVGGVAVYNGKISPAGVGFDIACGNKAVRLDLKLEQIQDRLPELAESIWSNLSFGVGRKNATEVEHDLFNDTAWSTSEFLMSAPELKKKAKEQLGTIGSGNHYVDVFIDEGGYIWVGVHFGSRGLGHTIASHFMKLAGDNTNIMDETPHTLEVNSKEGQEYLMCMNLAGRYAYAGRDWVCQRVADILGGSIVDEVHNHHNFAWEEVHNGKEYWVVRKGATPAFPGQRGFVGSNMADMSLIIKGIDSELSRNTFYSTVHGAGRIMSRTKAAGRFKGWGDKRVQVSKGAIDFDLVKSEMAKQGIILKGAGADEAPAAYKKLDDIVKYHEGTVLIENRLRPLIVCMAGGDEFDPYKD
jgi:tRNA-splicing ligase RtcB